MLPPNLGNSGPREAGKPATFHQEPLGDVGFYYPSLGVTQLRHLFNTFYKYDIDLWLFITCWV
jgi:hypothetical protein